MFDSQYLSPAELDALDGVLDAWRTQLPGLGLLAMLPEGERARVPALQAACRRQGIALCGGIFPALVHDAGFAGTGATFLRFADMPPAFLLDEPGDADRFAQAVERGLAGLEAPAGERPLLFLVFDGMLPNIGTLLHELYVRLRRLVGYAGVNAGSESFRPMPCLFDGERLIGNAVLGLLLPAATRLAVEHGYPVSRSLMRASATAGNRIASIDGRPALTVYQEVIKAEYGITLTRENFYDYAVHYPFGVVTALDVLVRIPVAFHDDGSLLCIGEVPVGTPLRLLKASSFDGSLCAEMVVSQLAGGGAPPAGDLLAFYCAGRRMHFGADAAREVARLQSLSGAPRVAGALSLGEIDTDRELGMPRFHNATLVCLN